MTGKERVIKALKGENVDRLPVSAWHHFPLEDKTHDGSVKAFIKFQETYNWDIAKLMYRNTFSIEEWGCESDNIDPVTGTYLVTKHAIQAPKDWENIKPLDVTAGALGETVSITRVVCQHIGKDVMKLATVFAPFMLALRLAGEQRIVKDMREQPALLHQAMDVITKTVMNFSIACLDAGADGVFFATTEAHKGFATRKEYAEFGHTYNLQVLNAIREKSEMTMLHICKKDIYFDEFVNYPVDAINWDDQNTPPSLAEARKLTDKCLIGGVDRYKTICSGSPEEIEAQVIACAQSAGTGKLIIAPGCTIPYKTPEENLKALRRSVEKIKIQ